MVALRESKLNEDMWS